MFFAANTTKLFEGGWLPLLIASTVAFVMLTWRKGQQLLKDARSHLRVSTGEFLEQLRAKPPIRVPARPWCWPLLPRACRAACCTT